jgi:hypothetical protein
MGSETTVRVSSEGLSVVTALAAATSGLQQTIVALAACHGGKSGPWLAELEASLVRDTKNIVFNGASIEAEAAAVEFALETIRVALANVRRRLSWTLSSVSLAGASRNLGLKGLLLIKAALGGPSYPAVEAHVPGKRGLSGTEISHSALL